MGCQMGGGLPEVTEEQIAEVKNVIDSNDVVLFLKGTKDQPVCGFSATAVQVLNHFGVEDFTDVNVFDNREMAFALIKHNDWQTFPQLFVKGEFVGSTDIIREMASSGEFEQLLRDKGIIEGAAA